MGIYGFKPDIVELVKGILVFVPYLVSLDLVNRDQGVLEVEVRRLDHEDLVHQVDVLFAEGNELFKEALTEFLQEAELLIHVLKGPWAHRVHPHL